MLFMLPTLLEFEDAAIQGNGRSIGVNTAINLLVLVRLWASSSFEMHRLRHLLAMSES
jgi:hypothetical protein